MSRSLDIVNTLGSAPKALVDRVEAYFEKEKSPVPTALAELNELVGFPYRLRIDWQTIREETPKDVIDDAALSDLVCSSTFHFLRELLRLLENDNFSETFLERTQGGGREISIKIHSKSATPFSRIREDAVHPTLELYLPQLGMNSVIKDITSSCGKDLPSALNGLSDLDEIKSWSLDKDFLPKVKDLPRPALALNQGPIHIRIIESLEKEIFEVEGAPPVVELIQEYIYKHANHRHNMDFTCWARENRLGKGASDLLVSNYNSQMHMTPMVIISLLEGSLGFNRVGEPLAVGNKLIWLFRRKNPFLQL